MSPSASSHPILSTVFFNNEVTTHLHGGYIWAGIALVTFAVYTAIRFKSSIDMIPAVGHAGSVSSYISTWHYLNGRAKSMLQEGHKKYKSSGFRIPMMNGWAVVVSNEDLINELRKAPEEVLSCHHAIKQIFALDYTFGPNIPANLYHIPIIRSRLTRNLVDLFPQVKDEVGKAFSDLVPLTDGWVKVKASDAVMKIVARATNRAFVGLTVCREPEYLALVTGLTMDVAIRSRIINLFPEFLRPLASRIFTDVTKMLGPGLKYLGPIIEGRKRKIEELGADYHDKPNDMLSWLMDVAEGDELSTQNLTLRILVLNFAAVHTTSTTFTHALYHIASRPEYIAPIRAEIETVVAQEGWSKDSLSRMQKLDSFLKESARMTGIGGLTMPRIAMRPYTFANGMAVPKGTRISVLASVRHCDPTVWARGDEFDGFRFANEENGTAKSQFTTTGTNYLFFGHGRDACPGRFFAANAMKTMMAHMLLTYDLSLEQEGVRPEDQWLSDFCQPNPHANVLFRKRQT